MAVSARLLTYPEATFTPQDFSIMLERVSIIKTGILYGCKVERLSTNSVTVRSGWIAVRGRLVFIDEGTLNFALPASGTLTNYVLITVDLSNTLSPSKCEIVNSIPTDETEDFNFSNGRAYCSIATITSDPTGITNIDIPPLPEKGVEFTYTLVATNWDAATKTYVVSSPLITETSDQEFLPSIGITDDQLKALQKANIQDAGQNAGSAIIKAYGNVPAIDIPIRIKYRGG